MKRYLSLLLLVALSAALAACGGGGGGGSSSSLGSGDVAVVGDTHVTTGQFAAMMASAEASYKQQGQPFPKQGSTSYQAIRSQAVTLLVQQAERADEAKKEGVSVSDSDVDKRLAQIKKQFFKGDEKKYEAELKKAKLTDATFRKDIKQQLVEEKLYAKITKDVKITDAQVRQYYNTHLSQYEQPRDVEYMLIKKKSLAFKLYTELTQHPDQWCADAKKYSGDPSTAKKCGKATFSKGQTVGAFDNVLFTQKAVNVIHPPVYDATSYKAYFLVKPLSPLKTQSLKQVSASIRQQLLQPAKSDAISKWTQGISKQFCSGSRIKYQVGYAPSPDPCTTATTTNTTTT